MIPKIVHYCWFGGSPKSEKMQSLISGWKRILSDCVFIEWNENNFDISSNTYASEAYAARRFAYVSDVARLHALYTHGGIYLDTDVELLKNFDDFYDKDVVFGFEEYGFVATSTMLARKKSVVVGEFLSVYNDIRFLNSKGDHDLTTNVQRLKNILTHHGLVSNGERQRLTVDGEVVVILPKDYFSPYDYGNKIMEITANTVAIHHYDQTWADGSVRLRKKIVGYVSDCIGGHRVKKIKSFINRF